MSESTQLVIVGVLIAAAAGYVLRSWWKAWFGKSEKGCGAGCGKCAAPPEPEQKGRYSLPQL
ncbi:MAG: FeoB-associated Cys-rich membrane protein [Planctomycetes bacterium]|nr:FeoB-associated Cys-rich membrane protein [Planctomycetota bacterium]